MLGIILTLLALFAALSFAFHPESKRLQPGSERQRQIYFSAQGRTDLDH